MQCNPWDFLYITIRPPAIRRYVAEAKVAVAPVRHLLSGNPAGDPPDLNVGRLNQLQGLHFLQQDIHSFGASERSLGQKHLQAYHRSVIEKASLTVP